MIDINREELLTLAQAARRIPSRTGKGLHVSTVGRWALKGLRGVKLETIQVGGTKYTSKEAVQRFFDALTRLTEKRRDQGERLDKVEAELGRMLGS